MLDDERVHASFRRAGSLSIAAYHAAWARLRAYPHRAMHTFSGIRLAHQLVEVVVMPAVDAGMLQFFLNVSYPDVSDWLSKPLLDCCADADLE